MGKLVGLRIISYKNDKGAIERRITENRKFDVIYMPDLPNTTNNNNTQSPGSVTNTTTTTHLEEVMQC